MSKRSPYELLQLQAAPSSVVDAEFFDPKLPNVVYKMAFRPATGTGYYSAIQRASALYTKHVTGFGVPGSDDFEEPEDYPPLPNGDILVPSLECIQLAVSLEMALVQDDLPADERYNYFDFLVMMHLSNNIMHQMVNLWDKLSSELLAEEVVDPKVSTR